LFLGIVNILKANLFIHHKILRRGHRVITRYSSGIVKNSSVRMARSLCSTAMRGSLIPFLRVLILMPLAVACIASVTELVSILRLKVERIIRLMAAQPLTQPVNLVGEGE
jgi:hypothetical protein